MSNLYENLFQAYRVLDKKEVFLESNKENIITKKVALSKEPEDLESAIRRQLGQEGIAGINIVDIKLKNADKRGSKERFVYTVKYIKDVDDTDLDDESEE